MLHSHTYHYVGIQWMIYFNVSLESFMPSKCCITKETPQNRKYDYMSAEKYPCSCKFFDRILVSIYVSDQPNHPSDIRPVVIFSRSLAHNS